MKDVWTVLLKDISVETRGGRILPSAAIFAVVIAVVFHFANPFPSNSQAASSASAAFWICALFSAAVAFERSFETEKKSEAIRTILMTPADRGAVFIGKMLGNLLLLLAIEAALTAVFTLFFSVAIHAVIFPFIAAALAGSVGIAAVGTIISALSAQTKMKGAVLPILSFPLLIPLLISASLATSSLLGAGAPENFARHLKILISFDLAFIAAGTLLYGLIVEEF